MRCRSARLADRAAAVALPLLCADGLKVHEADAGKAALTLAGSSSARGRPPPSDCWCTTAMGPRSRSRLALAGGALPSFPHDAVGRALRELYTARPGRGGDLVHAPPRAPSSRTRASPGPPPPPSSRRAAPPRADELRDGARLFGAARRVGPLPDRAHARRRGERRGGAGGRAGSSSYAVDTQAGRATTAQPNAGLNFVEEPLHRGYDVHFQRGTLERRGSSAGTALLTTSFKQGSLKSPQDLRRPDTWPATRRSRHPPQRARRDRSARHSDASPASDRNSSIATAVAVQAVAAAVCTHRLQLDGGRGGARVGRDRSPEGPYRRPPAVHAAADRGGAHPLPRRRRRLLRHPRVQGARDRRGDRGVGRGAARQRGGGRRRRCRRRARTARCRTTGRGATSGRARSTVRRLPRAGAPCPAPAQFQRNLSTPPRAAPGGPWSTSPLQAASARPRRVRRPWRRRRTAAASSRASTCSSASSASSRSPGRRQAALGRQKALRNSAQLCAILRNVTPHARPQGRASGAARARRSSARFYRRRAAATARGSRDGSPEPGGPPHGRAEDPWRNIDPAVRGDEAVARERDGRRAHRSSARRAATRQSPLRDSAATAHSKASTLDKDSRLEPSRSRPSRSPSMRRTWTCPTRRSTWRPPGPSI